MSEINWELFERVLSAIKANPANWDQSQWHCGTSHCFAGFAQIIDLADRGIIELEFNREADDECQLEIAGEEVWVTAERSLGISSLQADWLFHARRSLEDFEDCLQRRVIPKSDDEDLERTAP